MKTKLKENFIKRFVFGFIIAWTVTIMLTGLAALLIKNETISINGQSIIGIITFLLAGFVSSVIAAAGSEKRAVAALVNGGLYYVSLLIFALLFTDKLSGKILIDLPIITVGSLAGAMCYRKKRRGVPRIK